jgi:hypothetical protein
VRAWRGLPRFEERSQLSTWLYRIAFNEAQRRLSRRVPRRAEPEPDGDDAISSLPESPDLAPEAQTLDHEFEQTLERALDQLPADWRAAVVKHRSDHAAPFWLTWLIRAAPMMCSRQSRGRRTASVTDLYWSGATQLHALEAEFDRMAMACCAWGAVSMGSSSNSIVAPFTPVP